MKYSWSGAGRAGMRSNLEYSGEEILRQELTKNMDTNRLHRSPTKRGKRFRSAFTTDQIYYLEKQFKKFPYIGNGHRKEVAMTLNIPERAVKIWFQNRRMKEKKDAISKEFDDQQNERKNGEFVKDQLNNVSTLANDEQSFSLPILTNPDTGMSTKTNLSTYSTIQSHSPNLNYYEEMPIKDQAMSYNITQQSPKLPKLNNSSEYKSSAEFSIDLCKKYKTETAVTNNEDMKIENKPEIKQQVQSNMPLHNMYMKAVQDSPEDLSAWKKPLETKNENIPRTLSSNDAGYLPIIPSFYAQPYLSSGNMIWKPINVMPVMSTGTPAVTITSNQLGPLPLPQGHNELRKTCDCNCHMTVPVSQLPMSFQSPGNPQYIITAVPFQNSSSKF